MIGRIIEVATDQRHLSAYRGFMLVHNTTQPKSEMARIPLDDIGAVVANAHGLSYTNNLLVALADRGIPFVLCGKNHLPAGMLLPVDGHHLQSHRFEAQIGCALPVKKQLWAAIVKSKLSQQAIALRTVGGNATAIERLATMVRSGDPDNCEAQGARHYWQAFLGADFRRDQRMEGLNGLLNYGYTVLRATTARAVIAAGLHPSIGLNHSNDKNPMRLVDDLMEPFRPAVDLCVHQLSKEGQLDVTNEAKKRLVSVMYQDIPGPDGLTPLMVSVQKLATSLALVLTKESNQLALPL